MKRSALTALLVWVPVQAPSQQVVPGLVTRVAAQIEARDANALSRDAGVFLLWKENFLDPQGSMEQLHPKQLFSKLERCSQAWVSEEYGEVEWVCKDRPVAGQNCFDQAIIASAKQYPQGVAVLFRPSDEWSVKRCGKAPLFAPPPPPSRPKSQ